MFNSSTIRQMVDEVIREHDLPYEPRRFFEPADSSWTWCCELADPTGSGPFRTFDVCVRWPWGSNYESVKADLTRELVTRSSGLPGPDTIPRARPRDKHFGGRMTQDDVVASNNVEHQHTPKEERRIREAALDQTIESSFPASDPPSSNPNPDDHTAVDRALPRQNK